MASSTSLTKNLSRYEPLPQWWVDIKSQLQCKRHLFGWNVGHPSGTVDAETIEQKYNHMFLYKVYIFIKSSTNMLQTSIKHMNKSANKLVLSKILYLFEIHETKINIFYYPGLVKEILGTMLVPFSIFTVRFQKPTESAYSFQCISLKKKI